MERVAANARVQTLRWMREPHRATLEWSASRPRGTDGRTIFRAEYIRLELTPVAVAVDGTPDDVTASELRRRVRREPNGDAWMAGVPMVDQGQKGYCAVAVLERVLRYYGREFDQHQAAQIAGSTAEGTSMDDLADAARRIAMRLQLRFRALFDIDLRRLVEDYNRRARRARQPAIETGRAFVAQDVYGRMRPDLLREARLEHATDRRRFFEQIRENIERGVPLLWGVMLGIVPERPALPQAAGGHLRLIIGVNDARQEILYSDSWGRGHERKRMSADDAWAITTSLHTVVPRSVR
jgi:hypothetical protein